MDSKAAMLALISGIQTLFSQMICFLHTYEVDCKHNFITMILNWLHLSLLQLQREIRPFPKLKIKREVKEIDDFRADDFEICDYNPHPAIKMQMAV